MKTSNLILLFMVFVWLLNGCGYVVAVPQVPTIEEETDVVPTVTLEPTPTFTALPILTPTNTPEPTDPPKPTLVPTPTTVLTPQPVEWDVDPYIIEDIEGEYKGVTVKASLIVDKSLEDIVESVRVNDDIFAEAIVKSFVYVIYQRKSNGDFYTIPSYEVDRLVKIWAEAQKTGSETYWRQVQLDNIWANDLNDGNGYSEKVHNFWPMYEGTTPNDVLAMDKITLVYFDCSKSSFVNAPAVPGGETVFAWGSSLDNKNLVFYIGEDIKSWAQQVADLKGISLGSATEFVLKLYAGVLANYLIVNDDKIDLGADGGVTVDVYNLLLKATEYTLKIE